MTEKFTPNVRVLATILAFAMFIVTFSGCSSFASQDMLDKINAGESIIVGDTQPSIVGKYDEMSLWVQLDALRTHSDMRLDFDSIFNINKITVKDVNSKSGCLYVDSEGDQKGNATLQDAFRNKVFVEKYWNNPSVKSSLIKLASKAYTDVDTSSKDNVYASLNAYYDLLTDNIDPASFNDSQSVTREQFYAFVYKSANGVQELNNDQSYLDETGGKTEYSLFAQQIENKAFLNTQENCLDKNNARGSISRAEAVYLVVNEFFADELKEADGKQKCYRDCKNAGDLALKAKFKEKNGDNIEAKENWQTFTLAFMMQNPDKGMQEELYKAMVVAYNLGLLGTGEDGSSSNIDSRWDEPISKGESMKLISDAFLAQNKLDGYLSTAEYGNINETKIQIESTGSDAVSAEGDYLSSDTMLSSGITLGEAKGLVMTLKESLIDSGVKGEEFTKLLSDYATSLGTDLATVDSLATVDKELENQNRQQIEEQKVAEKPAQTNSGGKTSTSGKTSNTNTSKGTSSTEDSGNSGGSYTPVDKNGDGFDDFFGSPMPSVKAGQPEIDSDIHME